MSTSRRDLLRLAASAMALTACGRATDAGAGSSAVASSTSSAGAGAAPNVVVPWPAVDPSRPWWLQGNFAPVTEIRTETDLPIEGALPPQLTGLYVRAGANPPSGQSTHWFMGDGMVHGVRLEAGRALWYRNRYVETALHRSGGALTSGIPGRDATTSNVAAVFHGGRLMTLGEIGFPFELSRTDLSTTGMVDFEGRLGTNVTAHPKVHPGTGRLHFFGYDMFGAHLTYMVADAAGRLTRADEIPIDHCHMIHDFAITETHAVFWVLPVVFDLAVLSTGMPFRWDPTVPSRVGVLPLDAPVEKIRWYDVAPQMVFHGVNAWNEGDDIVAEVCRMDDAFNRPDLSATTGNEVRRWRMPAGSSAVREETVSTTPMDFPAVDKRHWGLANRVSWFTTIATPNTAGIEPSGIARRDNANGVEHRWDPAGRWGPGEVTFVPDSDGAGEGEGWLLTYAYDRTTDRSALAVLDATDVARGPVALVHLPVRVPYGFHGTWVPETT